MRPYYQDDLVTLYHGDCVDAFRYLNVHDYAVMVTDPPYGISYHSGMTGHDGGTALPGIHGDTDTLLRDVALEWWGERPAIVFGSWKRSRPACSAVLVWDKGDHVGMGDLALPWKPNTEEIYVIGSGFSGHRGSSVLRYNAPVTWNSSWFGRTHAHEKPVDLMKSLLAKCPSGAVIDPFCGSGSTLRAAKDSGRRSTGIEVSEQWCEVTANRLRQGSLAEMFQ